MPLAAGARLGPYEIVGLLGAGGMGEVYRARDARLGRDVALKVLPAAVATDPDRRARFEREARAVAALSHPNLLAIFEFAVDDGTPYAVTELLDGQTLREMLESAARPGTQTGALTVRKAVDIATQVSRGLAAAHAKGIVHRDIKPDNLFVSREGHVKILDFGLAKTAGDTPAQEVDTTLGTDPGTVVGTVSYMAPEQIRAQAVDGRTDLFALGAVLYEMLAGRRAFARDTSAETMAAILKEDPPDLSASRVDVPVGLTAVVRHCLERNPNERFQSARDLAFNLQALTDASGSGPTTTEDRLPISRSRMSARETIAWSLAGVVALASVALVMWSRQAPPASPSVLVRFEIPPPFGQSWAAPLGSSQGSNGGTISPDGHALAFVSPTADGKVLLWVRPVDSFTATALPDTDNAAFPFWSPDSRSLAFFTQTRLRRVAADGGPVQTVTDLSSTPRGGSWSQQGVILFATAGSPVMRVSASGGQPTAATKPDAKNPGHQWPSFLPDGDRFLYYASGTGEIYLGSLGSVTVKPLLKSDTDAFFAPPGSLLFIREGTLFEQRLDMTRFEPVGEPVPVVPNVSWDVSPWNHGAFSVSWDGVLTFRHGGGNSTQFAWFDRTGRRLATVGPPGDYLAPALSPDETRVAFTRRDGSSAGDIWTMDLARQTQSRFTFGDGTKGYAVWSSDGQMIAYESTRDGLFASRADGTGAPLHLLGTPSSLIPEQLVPERNELLYFADMGTGTGFDVYVLPLTPNAAPRPVIQSAATEVEAQLSPDGRWIAYSSSETSDYNVFVQPFPTTGAKFQISTAGGRQVSWRRDGKELYFVTNDAKLYAVDVRAGATFEFSPPRYLFTLPANTIAVRNSYVASRDGQRFFINERLDATVPPINVDLAWRNGTKR